MRFKRQTNILFSLESVAFTDIIMNMFIFFFITFSFLATFNKANEGQMEVNLPKAVSATPLVERKRLSVNLTKDGGLFLDKEVITIEKLHEVFRVEKATGADITADEDVPHGRVVTVMDLARTEGLARLAIATQTR
jgi:biopolymer transport protein ExbD